MKRLLLTVLVAVFGVTILTSGAVLAQRGNEEGENITLSPAITKPDLKAGEEHKGELKVINNGQEDYTFIVYSRPFSVDKDTYKADFVKVNKYTEVYQWISFPKSSYQLKSGESATVPYIINVPEDARPGGHYAVLFAETQPEEGVNSVARKKRVGSLVYATVDGEYQESGSLEQFTTKTWFTKGPVTSDISVKNDGNVHFETDVDVVYKNIFGRAVYGDKQTRVVMPGTTRKFTTNWEKPPLFGIYKTTGSVEFLGKSENLPSKYIVVMPYWLLAIIIVLPLAFLGLKIVRKTRKK